MTWRIFFEENTDFEDSKINGQIESLSQAIKLLWQTGFDYRFPDRHIVVETFKYYDATSITVYEQVNN